MSKNTDLLTFLEVAREEFGKSSVYIADKPEREDVDFIPTGVAAFDIAFGGGIPRGRITEVLGGTGVGKTTLCLQAIKEAQSLGLQCAFIDAENAISFKRMDEIGIDRSNLIFSQPNSAQDALNLVEMICNAKFDLVVIDSVAALIPSEEVEKEIGASVMGLHARLMSQAMRKISPPARRGNVAVVFINQMRSQIGPYAGGDIGTGGKALPYFSSLRVSLKKKGLQSGSPQFNMIVLKNKVGDPFGESMYEIEKSGINTDREFVKKLLSEGVLEKAGSHLKYEDKSFHGFGAFQEAIKDDDFRRKLVQQLHTNTNKPPSKE